MTAYTHTESSQRFGHLRAHLPAYLVGVGATAALTAGAFVIFLSLATLVAFNGTPFAGSSDDAGAAYLDSTSLAPAAAATALGAGPGAVAKSAAPGSDATSPAARSAAAAAAGSGDPSGADSSGKAPGEPGVSTSPEDVAAPPIAVPLPSTSGPVTDAIQAVDSAAGTNLSGPAGGAAGAADGVANQAGGAAGRAGLGGRVGGAVRGVTDRALGAGAGSLLGP